MAESSSNVKGQMWRQQKLKQRMAPAKVSLLGYYYTCMGILSPWLFVVVIEALSRELLDGMTTLGVALCRRPGFGSN